MGWVDIREMNDGLFTLPSNPAVISLGASGSCKVNMVGSMALWMDEEKECW